MKDKQIAFEKNFDAKLKGRDTEAGLFKHKPDNDKFEKRLEFYKKVQAWRRESRKHG